MYRVLRFILITFVVLFSVAFTGCTIKNSNEIETQTTEYSSETNPVITSDEASTDENTTSQELINYNGKYAEDLSFFFKTLEEKHPDLYRHLSQSDYVALKRQLYEQADHLSKQTLYFELQKILSDIGDAHTTIMADSQLMSEFSYYPFKVDAFDDKWYLTVLPEADAEYLGWQLIMINQTDLDSVFSALSEIIPHENDAWVKTNFTNWLYNYDALAFIGVLDPMDSIFLTVVNDEGTEAILSLDRLTKEGFSTVLLKQLSRESTPETEPSGFYRWLTVDNNLVIQYNFLAEDTAQPTTLFNNEIIEMIKTQNFEKIILDYRYCKGGNDAISYNLIAELSRYKSALSSDFYVLMGNATFSSGVINVTRAIKLLDATTVGQDTGNPPNHFGAPKNYQLPNLGWWLSCSSDYFELLSDAELSKIDITQEAISKTLSPDIWVAHSIEDYKKGIDPEIEYLLNH